MKKIVMVMIVGLFLMNIVSAQVPPSNVYLGETKHLLARSYLKDCCVKDDAWEREMYTMCSIIDPDGMIVWSEGPTLSCESQSCIDQATEPINAYCNVHDWNCICDWAYVECSWGNYFCEHDITFNKPGNWTMALTWGYVNKTWDGSEWSIATGIVSTNIYTITARGSPPTPIEKLKSLFDLFINFILSLFK